MAVVPDTKSGKLEFCESRVDGWVLNAQLMGSSSAAVTSWQATVTAARASYDAQQAAQLAAKDATTNLNVAIATMMNATASIIKQVRAKADLVGNSVYALASLPVPATPSPTPAPGKPGELTVTLDDSGALKLKWKCPNPVGATGTIYQLGRRIGSAGDVEYLGSTGSKSFTDDTLPAGSAQVTYTIQAVRSTAMGPAAQFIVNFGVGAGGATMARVTEISPKIAA